jgi:hypothetical protein
MSRPAAADDDGGHSSEGSPAGKSKAAEKERGKKAEKAAALAEASRPGKANSEGKLLKTTGLLLAAVREGLRRKNCTNSRYG